MNGQSRLVICPLTLREANAYVRQHHRHHGPARGQKFSISVADESNTVRGVAIVGRPTSRVLDDGWTLEVLRLATDGCENACSALYGAAWRAGRAMGYRKVVTFTLRSESGTSLRASGWRVVGQVPGRSWSTPSRPRIDTHPLQPRFRWEITA
jgi:hypothetical protein